MPHLLRFLALYDWPESFDLAKHPEVLVRLVEDAGIMPTKATFFVPEEKKERRRTLYKNSKLLEVVAPFTNYSWVALDEPIEGDFRNVRSQLSFHGDKHRYSLIKLRTNFTLHNVICHLRLFCEYMTPRYGFAHSEHGLAALAFPWGTAVAGAGREFSRRIGDLGHSLRVSKEHLAGKLHDVYGVNILSPTHLELRIEGQSLGAWINAGPRGELLTINTDVFAWIVPDDVRSTARATLFKEGALIATV